jgi:hypothetical protein
MVEFSIMIRNEQQKNKVEVEVKRDGGEIDRGTAKVSYAEYEGKSCRLKSPRVKKSDEVCTFCRVLFQDGYLFTRKQIYACEHCTLIVDLLHETDSKIINSDDNKYINI